ncbi:MAG: hypothetical protein ABSE20_09730 [Acetobacteraceae bacterium]|jgi:hypothetical protein
MTRTRSTYPTAAVAGVAETRPAGQFSGNRDEGFARRKGVARLAAVMTSLDLVGQLTTGCL